jgi:formylglycine-generating enzyme required for sulfatase activity
MQTEGAEWQALLRKPRVALTGEAGSGKSTLLRHVGVQLAQALRQGTAPGVDGSKIPVFLDLAKTSGDLLAGRSATIQPERFLSLLGARLRLTPAQVTGLLRQGNVQFLFDGLDEVSDPADRDVLADALFALQRDYGRLTAPNQVIVACRSAAWGDGEGYLTFEKAVLQPMDRKKIHEYLVTWCRAVWRDAAEGIIQTLDRALSSSPAMGQIAANPQMSMLLALAEFDGPMPKQQALLFQHFIEKLGKGSKKDQAVDRGHLIALAVEMQRTAASFNSLKAQRAEVLLGARLGAASERETREKGKELLASLEVKTGLIEVEEPEGLGARNQAQVRFKHRTFQEYLVACHYAEEGWEELLDHAVDPAWSNVLALTSGVLSQIEEAKVKQFLEQILGAAPDDPSDAFVRRVAAASVCMVELASYELEPQTLEPARQAYARVVSVLEDPASPVKVRIRAQIADGLGTILDPRLNRPRWVHVPAGPFVRGSEAEDAWIQERPRAEQTLGEFMIQRWPVTVADYRRFIEDSGYERDEIWTDEAGRRWRDAQGIKEPAGWEKHRARGNRPVTGVSWWEARAFARWWQLVDDELPAGWLVRLPSEAEWEKAASGADEKRYPWGDEWGDELANSAAMELNDVVPVGLFPAGHSRPYGLWDMAGNVGERCEDPFGPYDRDGADYRYGHAVRGGSFAAEPLDLRVSYRFGDSRESRDHQIGFRCVAVPEDKR